MKTRDLIDLILLAALWGGSFLFMRLSVPEFGAIPMMMVRTALAGLLLLPLLIWKKHHQIMLKEIVPISIAGIIGSAIPFSLIAYSTLYITAGFASVLNAVTPMFTAAVAFIWLGHRLSKMATSGLMIGISGVLILVWDKIGFSGGNVALAIMAGISGTLCYGLAANYTKQKLSGVTPLAITTGSLLAAAIFLLPMAIYWWPEKMPSNQAWLNVALLAIACTAFAQVLFFRLIAKTGATNATTVTFLIPVFGLLWGNIFLDEALEIGVLIAGGVILVGTGMSTGMIKGVGKTS